MIFSVECMRIVNKLLSPALRIQSGDMNDTNLIMISTSDESKLIDSGVLTKKNFFVRRAENIFTANFDFVFMKFVSFVK